MTTANGNTGAPRQNIEAFRTALSPEQQAQAKEKMANVPASQERAFLREQDSSRVNTAVSKDVRQYLHVADTSLVPLSQNVEQVAGQTMKVQQELDRQFAQRQLNSNIADGLVAAPGALAGVSTETRLRRPPENVNINLAQNQKAKMEADRKGGAADVGNETADKAAADEKTLVAQANTRQETAPIAPAATVKTDVAQEQTQKELANKQNANTQTVQEGGTSLDAPRA